MSTEPSSRVRATLVGPRGHPENRVRTANNGAGARQTSFVARRVVVRRNRRVVGVSGDTKGFGVVRNVENLARRSAQKSVTSRARRVRAA